MHILGRTDAEAPILCSPDMKSQLIGKDPDAGKDWSQKEKGDTEDKMVRYHHWLSGHESEQMPGCRKRKGAQHAAVHGVAKSLTWLSNWTTITTKNTHIAITFLFSPIVLTLQNPNPVESKASSTLHMDKSSWKRILQHLLSCSDRKHFYGSSYNFIV